MKIHVSVGVLLTLSLSACSASSIMTPFAAVGTLAGAGLGAVTGAVVAATDDSFDKNATIALGTGAGAATGVIVGAMMHERQQEIEKIRPIVREPMYTDNEVQREIDGLRQEMRDDSSYGRSEVKPWDDRYLENDSLPYQGVGVSR